MWARVGVWVAAYGVPGSWCSASFGAERPMDSVAPFAPQVRMLAPTRSNFSVPLRHRICLNEYLTRGSMSRGKAFRGLRSKSKSKSSTKEKSSIAREHAYVNRDRSVCNTPRALVVLFLWVLEIVSGQTSRQRFPQPSRGPC